MPPQTVGPAGPTNMATDLTAVKNVGNASVDTNPPAAQLNAAKSKDPRTKDPTFIANRFEADLNKKFADTATGESIPEILLYKSGGRNDWRKRIKLFIMKEFWNKDQVLGVFMLGLFGGMLIILAIAVGVLPGMDYNLFEARGFYHKFASFLVALGGGILLGKAAPHGLKKCRRQSKGTDPALAGSTCLDPYDCTRSNKPYRDSCKYPSGGTFVQALRYITYLSVIVGIVLLILNRTGNVPDVAPATSYDIWISVIFGFGTGQIAGYFLYT